MVVPLLQDVNTSVSYNCDDLFVYNLTNEMKINIDYFPIAMQIIRLVNQILASFPKTYEPIVKIPFWNI